MVTDPERARNYQGYIALTRELFELYPDGVLLTRERRRIAVWEKHHPNDSQEPTEKYLSRWYFGGILPKRRERLDGLSGDTIHPLVEALDSALGKIDPTRAKALRLHFRLDDEQFLGLMSNSDVLGRLRDEGLSTGRSRATASWLIVSGIRRLKHRHLQNMNQIASFLDQQPRV